MAEIDLQQKRRPVWPWILGVVVVALAIWGIAEVVAPGEEELAETDPIEVVAPGAEVQPQPDAVPVEPVGDELPESVRTFTRTAQGFAATEMDQQHEYTANAIRQLVPALEVVVARDTVGGMAVQQQLDRLRAAADGIQQTQWTADTHADQVKSALTTAAGLLAQLRQDIAGADPAIEGAVEEIRAAADELVADQPLLDQRETVQRFFTASADVIERLARS
ncbi:MAG: hypothetical protein ACRELX_02920 [Longimicrobiales bacterium]